MRKSVSAHSLILAFISISIICCLGFPQRLYANGLGHSVEKYALSNDTSAAILDDKSLWMWGYIKSRNPDGSTAMETTPIRIENNVDEISLGTNHYGLIRTDGSLWMFGDNSYGQCGWGQVAGEDISEPLWVMDDVAYVWCGNHQTAAITTDGLLYMWGSWDLKAIEQDPSDSFTPNYITDDVASFSSDGNIVMIVKKDGSLWELNRASVNLEYVMGDVKSAVVAHSRIGAIKNDGSYWGWGYNNGNYSLLGNESPDDYITAPTKIMDGVKQVCFAQYHSAILKNDGSVLTWGSDYDEALGNGSDLGNTKVPTRVLSDVNQLAIGYYAATAIKSDGTLWVWGENSYGDSDHNDCSAPTYVFGDVVQAQVTDFSTRGYSALKTDGSLYMWGTNHFGQAGVGTQEDFYTPYKVEFEEEEGGGQYLVDSDGDALPDIWETATKEEAEELGIPWLAGMGADPNIPDIFVEVDWMVRPEKTLAGVIEIADAKSFQPKNEQMDLVAEAFRNRGINLHIDSGPLSHNYTNDGVSTWNDLSKANEVEYSYSFESMSSKRIDDQWSDVDRLANSINGDGDRNFADERRKVFHYCIFVDTYDGSRSSGYSRQYEVVPDGYNGEAPLFYNGGQYFLVAAGVINRSDYLYSNAIAGTFMHELGHNLGLGHGGNQATQYKPNYLSVMNYAYQFLGLSYDQSPLGTIDYSECALPSLDENDLNELDGVDPEGAYADRGAGITICYSDSDRESVSKIANEAIDWNRNGSLEDHVKKDINGDGSFDSLSGFCDWDHLVYSGAGSIGAQGDSALPVEQDGVVDLLREPTVDEAIKLDIFAPQGSVDIVFVGPYTLFSNQGPQKLYVDISNLSHAEGSYDVLIEGDIFDSPESFNVNIAGSVQFPLSFASIAVPTNANLPTGEYPVTVRVTEKKTGAVSEDTFTVSVLDLTDSVLETLKAALEDEDSGLPEVVAEQYEEIVKQAVSDAKIEITSEHVAGVPDQAWTGNPVCPTPSVNVDGKNLVEGVDFTYSYEDNIDPGTGKVIVTGNGDYSGSVTVTFKIVKPEEEAPPPPSDTDEPGKPNDPDTWDNPFEDVKESDWFYDSVRSAYELGIMHGYEGTALFGPNDPLTREQAAAVLYNYLGEGNEKAPASPHSDVLQGQWYSPAVNWVVSEAVMNGYSGSKEFGVGDTLTREQFAAVIANALGVDLSEYATASLDKFPDARGVSDWARRVMAWAVDTGIISGVEIDDGGRELQAVRGVTRAEMAAMMVNAINKGVLTK